MNKIKPIKFLIIILVVGFTIVGHFNERLEVSIEKHNVQVTLNSRSVDTSQEKNITFVYEIKDEKNNTIETGKYNHEQFLSKINSLINQNKFNYSFSYYMVDLNGNVSEKYTTIKLPKIDNVNPKSLIKQT